MTWLNGCVGRLLAGALVSAFVACGSEQRSSLLGPGTVVSINELMASNSGTPGYSDEYGDRDDWIELINPSAAPVSLEGYYLSDDKADPTKCRLPAKAVVPANTDGQGGFLIVWADGEPREGDSPDAAVHLTFSLSRVEPEGVWLSNPDGHLVGGIDYGFPPTGEMAGLSYARVADGSGLFHWCGTPTPGAPNAADCAHELGVATGGAGGAGAGAGSASGGFGGLAQVPGLFDESRVNTIELEVADSDWQTIARDVAFAASNPTYVHARFRCNGFELADVGLRGKGSIPQDLVGATAKLSLKIDFDLFDPDQEFAGQVKLNLQSNLQDPSQLMEYLSYGSFRGFGIPAPRTGWADVHVNGQPLGLYTTVEQIGGRFLTAHFPDFPDGNLYKPDRPAGSLEYRGSTIEDYPGIGFERGHDPTHIAFLHMVDVLNHGARTDLAAVLDLDGVLGYLAGNIAVGNLNYYVSDANNYDLYESRPGVFTLLPWDMNESQQNSAAACDPCGRGANPWSGGLDFVLSERLLADAEYVQSYYATMRSFLQGAGSVAALEARIAAAEAVLGDRLVPAAVAALRSAIAVRVPALLGKLEGASSVCPPNTAYP